MDDSNYPYEPSSAPGAHGHMQPHRGTMILVFGILGLLVCQVFAFMAYFMGKADLAAMDAGTMDPTGRDNTNVGKILGLIGIILLIVTIVIMFIVFAVGLGAAATQM